MIFILIVVLLFVCIGGAPNISGHNYGWGPSGGLGLIVLLLVVWLLLGHRF